MGKPTSAKSLKEFGQYYHVKLTVLISILAFPLTYGLNAGFQIIDQTVRPLLMMASGFLLLISVVGVTVKYSYTKDWVYLGSVLFAFTAVIDLIITLEFNGVIYNFMSEYLNLGEPYLASPWGSAIALFDGVGFYFMYLMMAHLISNGKNWRSMGIYWAAGIIHSMIVLLIGVSCGKHSPTFCTFLNVPYVVFPIVALMRAVNSEPRPKWDSSVKSGAVKIADVILAVGFAASAFITSSKAITVLAPESTSVDIMGFLRHEKSILFDDPAPFAAIQATVFLLYLVPIQVLSGICFLLGYVPPYLWEINLVHAGIMMQGQFAIVGLALDPQTPPEYKSTWSDGFFWSYNLYILIVPHLVVLRLLLQQKATDLDSNQMYRKKV